jgi:hypothetical protein
MKAVLASASSAGSSCFGALDFLDSQVAFDVTFSACPALLVTVSSTGVSVDSVLLTVALNKFTDKCKFHLFVPIFSFNCFGTVACDNAASLHAAIAALKKLSTSSRHLFLALGLTCNQMRSLLPA